MEVVAWRGVCVVCRVLFVLVLVFWVVGSGREPKHSERHGSLWYLLSFHWKGRPGVYPG